MQAKGLETQMNADKTQMNAEKMRAVDAWALSWSQAPRSPRLPPAWKRRWSALSGEFKAVFWSWS